jgi:hypothetical protein
MRQEIRGSDVWLSTDLRNIMQALALTVDAAEQDEYARGYRAALAAVAVAIGVSVPPPVLDDAAGRQ